MSNLKYRVLMVVGLVLASLWALFPRETIERVRQPDGSIAYDTTSKVPLKLGLDLKGGMHLALEIDQSKGAVASPDEALDRALTVVRERVDEFGVAEPVVQKVGEDRIVVELPGIDDPQRAIEVVQQSAFLQFQITDEEQSLERVLPRLDAIVREQGGAAAAQQDAGRPQGGGLENLFTPGDSAIAAADSAADSTVVPTTGGPFSSLLAQGQIPGQFLVAARDVPAMQRYLSLPAVRAALPPGKVVRWQSDTVSIGAQIYRALYVLESRPIITGEYLEDAQPATDPLEGTKVTFELNNQGGRRFQNETARHIGDYMAIVLDDRVVGFPPVIQGAIGRNGQITLGGRTLQEAQDLALVLRAGALPVPLNIIEVRTIGPSLGQDSIDQGIRAGLLGIVAVILIMIGYYRFSGVLACAALVLYALFTLAILSGFGAALSLPGLAGLVLSIGIAVDANVLIFERIREELDHGKTVRTAIDEGFRGAMSAIVDSNVTTALTAVILYQFGTGPVQGFAVTLLAGIAASMISAVFVVRTFFLIWMQRNRGAQTVSI